MIIMKNIALAMTAVALMSGTMVTSAYADEKYYLLTDCTTVEDPEACFDAKVVPALVVGGFIGLLTGGIAFASAGGVIAAGETAVLLGTTVGIETALVGGAVVGAVTATSLTGQ
jgi:hypothetical protein